MAFSNPDDVCFRNPNEVWLFAMPWLYVFGNASEV
jgi:hypothetical protein